MPSSRSNAPRTSEEAAGSSRRKSYVPRRRQNRVLQEIKKHQRSTNLLIRKLPFSRLVREICLKCNPEMMRWQAHAILALQEAAEARLVQYFQDAVLLAQHAKRVTVMRKDFVLLDAIKSPH